MRHHVDHRKLGRTSSHRLALFKNQMISLISSERIKTTLPKAKELRGIADKMITLAKEGSLHSRRQAARWIQDSQALKKLFEVLGPRFKDRTGGYTRIYRLGFRLGDGAEMAILEYLGYVLPSPEKKDPKKEKEKSKEVKKAKKSEKKEAPKKTKKKDEKEPTKKKSWGLLGKKKKKEE